MPILSRCPLCQRQVRVPENLLGRKVRCPACQQTFVASAEGGAAPSRPAAQPPPEQYKEAPRRRAARREEPTYEEVPEEEDEEEPRPRRLRSQAQIYEDEEEYERPRRTAGRRADWAKVRTGVTLVLVSVILAILLIPIAIVIMIVAGGGAAAAAQQGRPGAGVAAFGAGVLVGVLLGRLVRLLSLIGNIICLAAPPKYGAKNLAVATLILMSVSAVCQLVSFLVAPLGIVGGLAYAAGFFVFLFFLRALARCLRADSLEASVKNLLILYGVTIGLTIVTVILVVGLGAGAALAAARGGGNPGAAGAGLGAMALVGLGCGCIDILAGLAAFIWYIIVLVQTRTQITYYLERG